MRYCGSITNLVKHLRFNHNTEYDEVIQRRTEEEEKKGALRARHTSLSFGCDRHYSDTERECLAIDDIYLCH